MFPKVLARAFLGVMLSAPMLGGQPPLRTHIDPARLRAATDSFVIVLQGQPRGYQRLTTAREGDGWRLGDTVELTGMVTQSSTVRLDGELNEVALRQEGVMRGKEMRITLDFAAGRVKGSALTPTNPSGAIAIDTAIQAGTVDDNALTPLLSSVRYAEGFQASFPVLLSGKGTIETVILKVVGRERVEVPAGTFDAWRIEMRLGANVTTVNVTSEAPYRLVRIQSGPAFESRLVK